MVIALVDGDAERKVTVDPIHASLNYGSDALLLMLVWIALLILVPVVTFLLARISPPVHTWVHTWWNTPGGGDKMLLPWAFGTLVLAIVLCRVFGWVTW